MNYIKFLRIIWGKLNFFQRHLYDEENLPLDELENDRQQRVYRGQPSTLSQVAKDRDGGGVIRHANALQVSNYFSMTNIDYFIESVC